MNNYIRYYYINKKMQEIELFNWDINIKKYELFGLNDKIKKFSNDNDNCIKIKNDVEKWIKNSFQYTYELDKINKTVTQKTGKKYIINMNNNTIIIDMLTYIFYILKTFLSEYYNLYKLVDVVQIKKILDNLIYDVYMTFIYKSQDDDNTAFDYIYTLYKHLRHYEKMCRMIIICKQKSHTKIIKEFKNLLENVMNYIQSNNLFLLDDNEKNIETELHDEMGPKQSKKSKKRKKIRNEKENEYLKELKYEEDELSRLQLEINNLKKIEHEKTMDLEKRHIEIEQLSMYCEEQLTSLYNENSIYNHYIEFQEKQLQIIKNKIISKKYNILYAAEQIETVNNIMYNVKCLQRSKSYYI
tara:strand:- start:962 stop:2029 length:1068 start_codon:yes stop_codon:yes gene_type:complete